MIQAETKLDTSFRLLVGYQVHTDQLIARIDVLTNNEPGQRSEGMPINFNSNVKQFNIELLTTNLDKSNLIVPNAIEAGVSIQVNGKDLVMKLRALADKLEQELL